MECKVLQDKISSLQKQLMKDESLIFHEQDENGRWDYHYYDYGGMWSYNEFNKLVDEYMKNRVEIEAIRAHNKVINSEILKYQHLLFMIEKEK
jgi:hypothetical protein